MNGLEMNDSNGDRRMAWVIFVSVAFDILR